MSIIGMTEATFEASHLFSWFSADHYYYVRVLLHFFVERNNIHVQQLFNFSRTFVVTEQTFLRR